MQTGHALARMVVHDHTDSHTHADVSPARDQTSTVTRDGGSRMARSATLVGVFRITKHESAPLNYVQMWGERTDAELMESLARLRAALVEDLQAGRKSVVLLDLRNAGVLTPEQRRSTAEWMKRVTDLFRRATFGTVFVVESALVRGVLTALLWFQPRGTPYEVVRDLDEAMRWAIACLDEAHVAVPSDLRRDLGKIFEPQLHAQAIDTADSPV